MARIVFFLCVILYWISNSNAQQIQLNKGDTVHIHQCDTTIFFNEIRGEDASFITLSTIERAFLVTDKEPTTITLQHLLLNLSLEFDGMEQRRSFNSQTAADRKGDMGVYFDTLQKRKYTIKINPYGKVITATPETYTMQQGDKISLMSNMFTDAVTISQPPIAGNASFFALLPEKKIMPGDTWERTHVTGTDTTIMVYRLMKQENNLLQISIHSEKKQEFTTSFMDIPAENKMTITENGTLWVHSQTGILVRKQSEILTEGTSTMFGRTTPLKQLKKTGITTKTVYR